MMTADGALTVSTSVGCASIFVCTLEILRRPEYLGDTHLLSWPASRLRHSYFACGPLAGFLDFFLRERSFRYVLYVRLIAAFICPFASGRTRGGLLFLLFLLQALWSLRSP